MAFNFIAGVDRWELPAPYAVTSGQGLLVGALFGIALATAANGANVPVSFEGIFDVTKEPSLAITQGARLFWDNTNRRLTTTATSNFQVGIAVVAAGASDTTVRCLVGARVPASGT
jgi:predicted RecA/RadA family phage recombinase